MRSEKKFHKERKFDDVYVVITVKKIKKSLGCN